MCCDRTWCPTKPHLAEISRTELEHVHFQVRNHLRSGLHFQVRSMSVFWCELFQHPHWWINCSKPPIIRGDNSNQQHCFEGRLKAILLWFYTKSPESQPPFLKSSSNNNNNNNNPFIVSHRNRMRCTLQQLRGKATSHGLTVGSHGVAKSWRKVRKQKKTCDMVHHPNWNIIIWWI